MGVLNARALKLVKPSYSLAAIATGAQGELTVEVIINENGCVIKATPVSGHIFFKSASVKAALASTFTPVHIGGKRVRARGLIVYKYKR